MVHVEATPLHVGPLVQEEEEEEEEEEVDVEVEVEVEGEGEIGGRREVMRGKRRGSSKGYLQEEVEKMERPLAISFEREENPVG
ncbi:hypothetical protein V1478_002806 [Vespula squamosa]|uniref:Uncharacterized protein n=1 Tax=Vespula squamosa TaxID=30214 RepID=A0ABD2BQW3_VESSQ